MVERSQLGCWIIETLCLLQTRLENVGCEKVHQIQDYAYDIIITPTEGRSHKSRPVREHQDLYLRKHFYP